MKSLKAFRWLSVGQEVTFTRKAQEAKGLNSHRKTGDKGKLLIISGGTNRNCLVQFDNGRDIVCWANLRPVRGC